MNRMPRKTLDLSGQKFGRLTAISRVDEGKDARKKWKCHCECGNTKIVLTRSLRSGATQSCGCLHRDKITKHGQGSYGRTRTITYESWMAMRRRCRTTGKKYYSDKGIKVCPRWDLSFSNFMEDMGERPSKEYTIDRIDSCGNYTPENCRWATRTEQARNTSGNRAIEFNGQSKCIAEWCEIFGISHATICSRLKAGMLPEKIFSKEALTKESRSRSSRLLSEQIMALDDEFISSCDSINDLSRKLGVNRHQIKRLRSVSAEVKAKTDLVGHRQGQSILHPER
jgi:hypothetical protein